MGRQEQHQSDLDAEFKHVQKDNTTEGGACLVGHDSQRRTSGDKTLYARSCNYRWQAFKRALDHDQARYNGKGGARDYDVTENGANFRTLCTVPYWHEAHHIIPNSELKKALEAMAKGERAAIFMGVFRRGLYDEQYNLNHMTNMIILPMGEVLSARLQLPRHRNDRRVFAHREYSKKVAKDLQKIFVAEKEDLKEHKKEAKYKKSKSKLESLSRRTRKWIFAVGGKLSLDEAAVAEGKAPQKTKA
jgi:hypothetical protein